MHRTRRALVLGLLSAGALAVASTGILPATLPILIVPEEVSAGKDLLGSAYSPYGGVVVTVRIGSQILWSNDASQGGTEVDFSVRVPRGSTGVVTVDAEDQQGNNTSADVTITP
jgi:hypothetical protein